jgi:NTE family protein
VKKLLESKTDKEITDQDYIEIIKTIEVDFLKATNKNIRMATFGNFIKNFQMLISSDYSRSNRIAELYNKYFYQAVLENAGNPVEMRGLKIYPRESPQYFHPKKHNAFRSAKVPILVLNATTLNSGRNWQFTAQTMGEPPNRESSENSDKFINVDKKPIRLRRARNGYQSMVKLQQKMPLGHAVAASASVPGLFTPLAIKGLYYDRVKKEKILPQLVDGGVFDNQGTESLLDNHCTQFVISDASGQMGIKNQISSDSLTSILRVSSILQDRARTEGLLHLIAKTEDKNKIAFMDLRKGLGIREISWINENNEPAEKDKIFPATTHEFGVDPSVQEKLSKMRTDLDAFTEVEAYSLMRNGYLMSHEDLSQLRQESDKNSQQLSKISWKFNQIAHWMDNPTPKYLKQLEIAQSTFGKVFKVFLWLWIPIILAIGGMLYYYWPQMLQIMLSSLPVYPFVIAFLLWAINSSADAIVKLIPFLGYLRPVIQFIKGLIKALLFSWGGDFY